MAQNSSTLENTHIVLGKSIYKIPLQLLGTQIQSFQFRIIHRTITCNKWLNNLNIKSKNKCNFCEQTDSMIHFLLTVKKTNQLWKTWTLWWKRLTGFDFIDDNLLSNV